MAQTIEYNIKVNDQGAATTIGQLETQLSDLNEEIKEVPVNSKRFKELKREINSVEGELEGANQALARFTAEDKVRAFQGSVDVLGGAISGTAGAAALFNVESEKFDELTARAAGAIAFAQGLKQGADGAIALTQSLQKSQKAQKLFASAQALVNTGLGKFKIALAATGIGALVVGIGLLVANFDKVSAAIKKFIGNSKILTGIVDTARNAFNSFVDAIRPALEFLGILPDEAERAEIAIRETATAAADAAEKELARAQARGASAKELFEIEQEILTNRIASLEDEEEKAQAIFDLELLRIKEKKRLADEEEAERKKRADERAKREEEEEAERLAKIEKEKEDERSRLEGIAAILDEYKTKAEDLEAETELQKLELEEERKLAELERLAATEEEKQAIRDFYAQRKAEAEAVATDEAIENAKRESEEKQAAALAELEARTAIEQAKFGLLAQFGGLLGQLAGESKELQIAAVIATQAAAIGQIISATGLANAKALAASPLTFGQPWVTINTVSAGLSIASAVASAAKSISQIKSSDAGGGIGGAPQLPSARGGSASAPTNGGLGETVPTGISPETQIRGGAVRAYVVSGDITSNQEAEAKLSTRRTISG
tara:strand:- start:473 stop:2299 length:1827 start_codon:yes stop_codon:yes gene_type:complete